MTVKIRSALNRIILLFTVTGMVLGLVNVALCDESYDTVRGFSEYQNEMRAPSLPAMADLISDTSANAYLVQILTERYGAGRQIIAGPDNTGRIDFSYCGPLAFNLCIFLLCVLPGTYFKHIFYIHLKDGNK